jgi:hypothetical protein
MAQGLCGVFQHGTWSYLRDLELYRELGIQGVCYEAYEPGYCHFSDMFEILAKAMNGEEFDYQPTELEQLLYNGNTSVYSPENRKTLEKYISDPFLLKQLHFHCDYDCSPAEYRKYVEFAFEYEDRLDPLFIGYFLSYYGSRNGKIRFRNLSPEAESMLSYRKLWDFMELIPADQDPRKICRDILFELLSKVEAVS